MADTYTPDGPGAGNPIGCVASWIVNVIRPPSPAYTRAESKAEPEPKVDPKEPVVARVRGIVVERSPVYQADGALLDDGSGPVVGITLVIDDDEAATKVLDAIQDGTPIRVLSSGCR